MFRLADWSER